MLRWRLLLGFVFVTALVGLFWGDAYLTNQGRPAGLLLVPLAVVVGLLAAQEYLGMVHQREPQVSSAVTYVATAAIVAAPWLAQFSDHTPGELQLIAFVTSLLAVVVLEICRYDKDSSQRVIERLSVTVLGFAYVGLLMSFVVRLRMSPWGLFPLISMLVVVKLGDIGAYTVGRLIGKHKLAPKLSPGKTMEGLAGGVLFSIGGFFGLMAIAPPAARAFGFAFPADSQVTFAGIPMLCLYAGVVCLTGVAGDLIESLLKRDFGRKDSSTWMPGFGGILDLVDSPLLAAPVAWAFWDYGSLLFWRTV
jgi:phosphatidate cytidylyltransferase